MLNAFRFALIYGIYTAEFSNSWKLGKELVAFLTGSSKIDFFFYDLVIFLSEILQKMFLYITVTILLSSLCG